MTKYALTILAGGGVALIVLLVALFTVPGEEVSNVDIFALDETGQFQEEAVILEATGEGFDTVFVCPDGTEFGTRYELGSNILRLTTSDGESYELSQSRVTTGARYASRDESVVFFEDAGMAQLQIAGETVLSECVVAD